MHMDARSMRRGWLRRLVLGWEQRWNRTHLAYNGGCGGSSLELFGQCASAWLPGAPHLVVLELNVLMPTEGLLQAERVLRNLLERSRAPPAVIFLCPLNVRGDLAAYEQASRSKSPWGVSTGRGAFRWGNLSGVPLQSTSPQEETLARLARHYGAALLSERAAILHVATASTCTVQELTADGVHPNEFGHGVLASLLDRFLINRLAELDTAQATPAPALALPSPMVAGEERRTRACYGFHEASDLTLGLPIGSAGMLRGTVGWTFLLSEPSYETSTHPHRAVLRKPGLVALSAGSTVELHLDTRAASIGSTAAQQLDAGVTGQHVAFVETTGHVPFVEIGYLTSYEHMGMATASCVAGCECETLSLDAHTTQHASITRSVTMWPSEHAACTLRVRVQNATRSGEHKFKLQFMLLGVAMRSQRAASKRLGPARTRGSGVHRAPERKGADRRSADV